VCRAVEQSRTTQRYRPKLRDHEKPLVKRMLEFVRDHPRFGYRRICALLRGEGWRVNAKRIYRLWRQEGLKVPRKQRKRRRLGSSDQGCVRLRAEHKDHVWALDFVHDRTADGRPLKWLAIIDEFTRECLALEVGRSIKANDVIDLLAELFRIRGVPKHIRADNGPEFIALAVRRWLERSAVRPLYIEPGSPWENGYVESFHGRFSDELLNREIFTTVREARSLGTSWRLDYNHRRPHSSLGYRTPAEFAAGCSKPCSAALRKPSSSQYHEPTLISAGS
jgi:transposase InsO family protein